MSYIIAEIASSHNGDIELAKAMVRAAAESGVDYVKFQSWQAKNVKDSDPDKKRYEKLELSDRAHEILIEECKKHKVKFLTSIFDRARIPFLKSLGVDSIKVPSTYCQSEEMLRAVKENFQTIIVSTGMTKTHEVEKAAHILRGCDFAFLHCVSLYPTPPEKVNLKRMLWLKNLAPRWGLSDHSHGIEASVVAMAMGADFIEKHFTLSHYLPQESHKTSDNAQPITTHQIADEPHIFKSIAQWRDTINVLMGSGSADMLAEETSVREKYINRLGN